jgi:hypothetical protein
MFSFIRHQLLTLSTRRLPDFIIGGHDAPYLKRWYVIPRNPVCNIYLHHFLRSDDDRALHDHPWMSLSIMLDGEYWEHTIAAGGIHKKKKLVAGQFTMRLSGKYAHRIDVEKPCWTLFITGPRYRDWGFHCPQGWVSWQDFTDPTDKGGIGKGCDQ